MVRHTLAHGPHRVNGLLRQGVDERGGAEARPAQLVRQGVDERVVVTQLPSPAARLLQQQREYQPLAALLLWR